MKFIYFSHRALSLAWLEHYADNVEAASSNLAVPICPFFTKESASGKKNIIFYRRDQEELGTERTLGSRGSENLAVPI